MEFEDIVKKVQWLEDGQRKSKAELTELGTRITSLNTNITALSKQLKSAEKQLDELSVAAARMEQFDQILAKQRTEMAKSLEGVEKGSQRREQEAEKQHQAETEELRKTIFEMRTSLSAEQTARKERQLDEQRRTAMLQDMGGSVESAVRIGREVQEAQKSMEEARRQDAKRAADLQAELAAVRKRADDAREKSALNVDGIRNLENRINELLEAESGRQERYNGTLQQLALQQVERDRAWKEWQEKFESFKSKAGSVEAQVAAFDDAIRAAKLAQEAYDGLNQRLERRLAEIGEVQRLADERLRQEWIAFKADEQKRWTGHALTQDEAVRELRKDVEKMTHRVSTMDDAAQTMQDQLQQTTETTERQLQEWMNVTQDWVAAYERIMGHSKAKTKKAVR